MTDDDKALVERLRALHVWPQSIADGHAELLTPRQIDKLYEVGAVSHKAADRIEALSAKNDIKTETIMALLLKIEELMAFGGAALGDTKCLNGAKSKLRWQCAWLSYSVRMRSCMRRCDLSVN